MGGATVETGWSRLKRAYYIIGFVKGTQISDTQMVFKWPNVSKCIQM